MPVTRTLIRAAHTRRIALIIAPALMITFAWLTLNPAHAQILNLPSVPAAGGPTSTSPAANPPDDNTAATSDPTDNDPGDNDPGSYDPNDPDPSNYGLGMTFDPDPGNDQDDTDQDTPDNQEDTDGTQAWTQAWLPQTSASYPNAVPVPGWPGALGLNLGWQAVPQTSPRPLVQVQGAGGDDLLTQSGYGWGTDRQAAADIDWIEIDWMRKYLVPTGELPGNGNGTPGNNFFDMMNGMASFTRGARALSQSSAWKAVYAGKIAQETPVWNSVCQWLTTPSVKSVGDAYNAPYTHRYWMGASVLRNEAYLLRLAGGTSNATQASVYDNAAIDYENQAMARQMGPGWMLALYPKNKDGTYRASILYNPADGDPIPVYFDGTKSNRQLHGEGVNPEQGDNYNQTWDAIYNPNGDKLAVWGIGVQGPGSHRQACSHAVDMNLLCAMQFLTSARDSQGVPIIISADGSSRVGTLDIYGNPKKVDAKSWRSIFQVQSGLAPDHAIYGGSHFSECRALFASVYHWLDNIIRNPSASIPSPPAIPADLYPTQ